MASQTPVASEFVEDTLPTAQALKQAMLAEANSGADKETEEEEEMFDADQFSAEMIHNTTDGASGYDETFGSDWEKELQEELNAA
jgi:hypothetical protein